MPSDDDLAHLSRIATEPGGIKSVGKILSDKKLPDHVPELAWIRIAVDQEKISDVDANKMFTRLSGVPVFARTYEKCAGTIQAQQSDI
ncbi:MAG: hypothetical protein OXE84_03260 [Rhodobacteraceae bacterium]|nr:hypothetical protein [Paracoccaceae bacterium]